jgi:hypothetical protein
VLGSSLHLIHLLLLDHPFEIFNWPDWHALFFALPEAKRAVAAEVRPAPPRPAPPRPPPHPCAPLRNSAQPAALQLLPARLQTARHASPPLAHLPTHPPPPRRPPAPVRWACRPSTSTE